MQTLVINISDDINLVDFSMQIKKLYPTSQIVGTQTTTGYGKKFVGIDDLKPLHVDDFKMFPRDELYDR
jgi:hypothetical protein